MTRQTKFSAGKWVATNRNRRRRVETDLLQRTVCVAEPLEGRLLLSKTIYVDVNSPAPATNGPSWSQAYTDLQLALGAAVSGDTIEVADGTYKPTSGTDRTISFQLKAGVAIYGGYAGYGAGNPDARDVVMYPTILSGDIGTIGTTTDNSYHVVVGSGTSSTAILSGFTITGSSVNYAGGGMYNSGGSPTLIACTFTANLGLLNGGGMANVASSAPSLTNCTFTGNSATNTYGRGGGMYNSGSSPSLNNCVFSGNIAVYNGGGIFNTASSSPNLNGCTFNGNSASGPNGSGGGVYNEGSSPTLTNCTFTGNNGRISGGGMSNVSSSSATLTSCLFTGNSAHIGGGMRNNASSPVLMNCIFTGNQATRDSDVYAGGGMYNSSSSAPRLTNCVFSGNATLNGGFGAAICDVSSSVTLSNCTISGNVVYGDAGLGGGIYSDSVSPTLTNCIVWANVAVASPQISQPNGTPVVTYSDVQGGWSGQGNVNVDPTYIRNPSSGADGVWATADDDYGDLRLQACSPLVDAGSNAGVTTGVTTDAAGQSRFVDVPTTADTGSGTAPIVDMGAYEAVPVLSANAGGPYAVIAGSALVLNGRGASAAAGDVQYAWDFNGDGLFDDATGSKPTFLTAGLPAGTITISLRVTDSASQNIIATAGVKIVPPVLYVDSRATGANDGSTWNNAFTNLTTAIAQSVSGQDLHVAGGTYKPTTTTDRTASFRLQNGVRLFGGYAGIGAANPDARSITTFVTILSGDIGVPGSISDNSSHVVNGSSTDSTAVIDGFTITGGNASGTTAPANQGGGMFIFSGSPTISNCRFAGNSADSGGGLFNGSASPTLTGCTFVGNLAGSGGGMANDATSVPTTINCTFVVNAVTRYGGAIDGSGTPGPITNCILWGDTAQQGSNEVSIGGTGIVTYSLIQGGLSGTGNISADPLFVRNPSPGVDGQWLTPDDDWGDLRLQPGSPAVDSGSNAAVPAGVVVDAAGNARFYDVPSKADTGSGNAPIVDMGAFETPSLMADAGSQYSVLSDGSVTLRGQGFSSVSDMLSFAWDFNGDGVFDDATGTNPVFDPSGRPWFTPVPVSLRVTNSQGQSVIATATVTIVPPIYVDVNASGAGTGASWTDAFTDLALAIAGAIPGQQIRVAVGTYRPTNTTDRTKSFQLKDGVGLFGGYAGHAAANPDSRNVVLNPTVLSGDIGTAGNAADNSYHVVVGSSTNSTAVIDGFTIVAGNASGSSPNDSGGGIYNGSSAYPTIRNCTFRGNSATYGSAMYNAGNGQTTQTLLVANCVFTGNAKTAIYNATSNLFLVNCTIVGSQTALVANPTPAPTLTNCILWCDSQISGTATVTYSFLRSGMAGVGNIRGDAMFVRNPAPGADGAWGTADDDYGDLRVLPWSPLVDAGNNSAVPAGISTDIAGNARLQDVPTTPDTGAGIAPIVDIGAYEASPALAAWTGGPYGVTSGQNTTLKGYGASPAAGSLRYEWEWTGDGKFDDAKGSSPVFSAAGMPAGTVLTLSLRVTDAANNSVVDSTTLTVLPVIFVDASAVGANNGTTWADAYTSLAAGLAQAVSGSEIHVADGTYKPTTTTDRTISFQLKNGVRILGGYAGFGAPNPDARDVATYRSVLSGDIGVIGDTSDNSNSVVTALQTDSTAVLDGCTITAGRSNGYGAGLLISVASPTISNCILTGNSGSYGGAMANSQFASPTVVDCTFTGNTASTGAGMYNVQYSSPNVIDCTFTGNTGSYGAGMDNESSSSPTLTNCLFVGNKTSGSVGGGAISNVIASAPSIVNCTFVANAGTSSGGIYDSASSPTIVNCIFRDTLPAGGTEFAQVGGGAVTVTYSDVQGGWQGTGNINADPLFIRSPSAGADGTWGTADDDYGDLHVRPWSPVVDAGNNAPIAGIATDVGGSARLQDVPTTPDTGAGTAPIVDIGAYEVTTAVAAYTDGPYSVILGQSITLHGLGAGSVAGALQFNWEWTGDGKFDDGVGPNPSLNATGFALGTWPVSLRVTDAAGQIAVVNTTVTTARGMVYVDANAAGANDGTTWTNAYTSLATALTLAVAGIQGQQIRVADGVYKATTSADRTATFQLKNGVSLQGGYAGAGAPNPYARSVTAYATILSGDIGIAGSNTDNSYHVVTGSGTDSTAVLDGFTITAANANGNGTDQWAGGGMYNSGGSPTVSNCMFLGNAASAYGGEMYNTASSPTLINCVFSGGTANTGPGIYDANGTALTLVNCTLAENAGVDVYASGGTTTIRNCILWSPSGSAISGGTNTVTYSLMKNGFSGTGNIMVDPLFVRNPSATDFGDLRLRLNSPAIDAGSNANVPAGTSTDLATTSRFQDVPSVPDTGAGTAPIVDMGAYEATWHSVVYVDPNATGVEDGGGWSTAYRDLAPVLAMVISGQEIHVADGSYKPTPTTDRTGTFQLKNGVTMLGGYAGYGAANPDARSSLFPSILSGDIGVAGNNTDNSYHVVTGGGTT
ncbi:MAG: right-handed parallel beta-helix repeat-containing protein, partial [Tepidisphaeraceae bacterium]